MYAYVRGTLCDNVRDRRARWVCDVRYLWTLFRIKVMGTKIKQHVYMATWENEGRWEDQPQICLGLIKWDEAVKHAKSQKYATRLSNTAGFNNQGYYFHPSDK